MRVLIIQMRRPDWGGLGLSLGMTKLDQRAVWAGLGSVADTNACSMFGPIHGVSYLGVLAGTVGRIERGSGVQGEEGCLHIQFPQAVYKFHIYIHLYIYICVST